MALGGLRTTTVGSLSVRTREVTSAVSHLQGRGPQRGEDWREAMLAGEGEPHLSSTVSIGGCGSGAKELLSPSYSEPTARIL